MSLSHTLWQANADLAQACLDQPFVRGIGDGSLPRPRFAGYIGQDAFYLQAFARAYAIAAAKAPDWAGFRELHELAGGVLQELELHRRCRHRLGTESGPNSARRNDASLHRFPARHRLGPGNRRHGRGHDALHEAVRLDRPAIGRPATRAARLQRLGSNLRQRRFRATGRATGTAARSLHPE